MSKIFKKKSQGFTLIELLVVISMIGLLASIVLVSLQGARNRARDVRIIADMNHLRSSAEIYFWNNNSYTNFCSSPEAETLGKDISAQDGKFYFCGADATKYCAEVQLHSGQWWCVDSALRSYSTSSPPACSDTKHSCE